MDDALHLISTHLQDLFDAWNRESNTKSSVDFTVQSSVPNIKDNALQRDKHTIATAIFINSATGNKNKR